MIHRSRPSLAVLVRPRYVQLSGYAQPANCTLAVMESRTYVVVPVVAMVAGSIVQGMNSRGPEYVPPEVLANFPASFNGRPIVPVHPYDGTGSANEPATQNKYRFGQVFNSRTDDIDGNLKLDAWLDIERATALGGDPASVVADCQAGKLVEVSLGAWIVMAAEAGELEDGRKYEYIWQYITSYDHLAMGLAGLEGACSVEMGCGGPRIYTTSAASTLSSAEPRRIVLIGGPLCGKSSLAREYRAAEGIPTYCTDPQSAVREPETDVTYLPEGLSWSESSQYVADNWLSAPGPWCVEGHATARALRKLVRAERADELQGVEIRVLEQAVSPTSPEQESLALSVQTVWAEIAPSFLDVASEITASVALAAPTLSALALAKARRPTFNGTETTTWSAPSWHEWVTALHTGTESPKSITDATLVLKSSIARHTLLGDPNAVTLRDLNLFPVVNPHSGRLNERALRAVLGGRGSAADISDAAKTSAQTMARELLKSEFDVEIADTADTADTTDASTDSESDTAADPKESANMAASNTAASASTTEPAAAQPTAPTAPTPPTTPSARRAPSPNLLARAISSLSAVFRSNGGSTDGTSDTELRTALWNALRASEPAFGWGSFYYGGGDAIIDVYFEESTVVYVTCPYDDVMYWRQTYTADAAGKVTLNGDREQVAPDYNWKPLPASAAADAVDTDAAEMTAASAATASANAATQHTAATAAPACGCHTANSYSLSVPAGGDPAAVALETATPFTEGDPILMAANAVTATIKTLAARLVANSSGVFTAEQIPQLEAFPEAQLTAMCEKFALGVAAAETATPTATSATPAAVTAPATASANTAASSTEPESFDALLARSPVEFQAFYAQGKAAMEARKTTLLALISAKSKATAAMLAASPGTGIEQLEAVATELGCLSVAATGGANLSPIPSYMGVGFATPPLPVPSTYQVPKPYDVALKAAGHKPLTPPRPGDTIN